MIKLTPLYTYTAVPVMTVTLTVLKHHLVALLGDKI